MKETRESALCNQGRKEKKKKAEKLEKRGVVGGGTSKTR